MTEQPSNHPSTEGVGRRLIENTFGEGDSATTVEEIIELIPKSKDIVEVISVKCDQEHLRELLQVVKDNVAEMPKLRGLLISGPDIPLQKPKDDVAPREEWYHYGECDHWCEEDTFNRATGLVKVLIQGTAIKEELAWDIIELLAPKLNSFLHLPQIFGLFTSLEDRGDYYSVFEFVEGLMWFKCFAYRSYEWGTNVALADMKKLVSGHGYGIRYGGFNLVNEQPEDWGRRIYSFRSDPRSTECLRSGMGMDMVFRNMAMGRPPFFMM
jgi:hypothetical protein